MALARSRTRKPQGTREPRNPYVALTLLVGLVGVVLVIAAAVYHLKESKKRARRVKEIRGVRILEELTAVACDFFYNEKKAPLPDEAWKPFTAYAADGDFVDAIITRSKGAEDEFVDAARYKEGMKWGMTNRMTYYGKRGPGTEGWRCQVQVVEGHVIIGGKSARVLFFRRPILVPEKKTIWEYGKATVILLREAPSPEPGEPPSGEPEVKEIPKSKPQGSGEKKAEAPAGEKQAEPARKPAGKAVP